MIIAFSGEKGGTGKTTLASNLAIMRAIDGVDVLLIDADPQGSLSEFARARDEQGIMPEITCTQGFGANLNSEIRKFKPKYDDIVIDVGGKDSDTLRSILLIANIVIVPFSNSKLDTWGLKHFNTLLKQAKELNPNMKSLLVLNKADENAKLDNELYIHDITPLDELTLMNSIIGYRLAFRKAVAEGQAVVERKVKEERKDLIKDNKKAIEEIKKFYLEIQEYE